MSFLRKLFACTPRKHLKARSLNLQVEPLEARLIPAVMTPQQLQLNDYWATRLEDLTPLAVVQPPSVPLASLNGLGGGGVDVGVGASSLLGAGPTAEKTYAIPLTSPKAGQGYLGFDAKPADKNSLVSKNILVYGYDTDGNQIPVKTLTITNNTKFTIYPILRDGNEAKAGKPVKGKVVGLYDPYDAIEREYRGYIGYKVNNTTYNFGLRPGASVTVRIPLVFWNGARLHIVTDGQWLTPTRTDNIGDPLNWNKAPLDRKYVIAATEPKDPKAGGKNDPAGVVMWYQSANVGIKSDSPDQLAEWSIRDRDYLRKISTADQIADDEKNKALINYDVSYVDSMLLPGAMEALQVPVPNNTDPSKWTQGRADFGWIGAKNSPEDVLAKIVTFTNKKTAQGGNFTGNYFAGGQGWPAYDIPRDPFGNVKIPSGQVAFADSTYANVRSAYDNNKFSLTSSGGGPIETPIGTAGTGTATSGFILDLAPDKDSTAKLLALQAAMKADPNLVFNVVGLKDDRIGKNPIQAGTTLVSIVRISKDNIESNQVKLSKQLVAKEDQATAVFSRPIIDYAVDAMTKLWYSWAQYYVDQTASTPPVAAAAGSINKGSKTLKFNAPVNGLVVGMRVTGNGLINANEKGVETAGVTILEIALDKKSVVLSQIAKMDGAPATWTDSYKFTNPVSVPGSPPVASLFSNMTLPAGKHFDFSKEKDPSRVPLEFAKKIYQVMIAMAQVPTPIDPVTKNVAVGPRFLHIMKNVIGGNMGFIFKPPLFLGAHDLENEALDITATIRDILKSVLRGVTDFVKFQDVGAKVWYPDPSVKSAGLDFGAFNLDPFVWFVHRKLGLSGYGFSLDDDTADIGAGGATTFQLTVGSLVGLPNQKEWTIQTPWGPLSSYGQWDPNPVKDVTIVGQYLNVGNATGNGVPVTITSTGKVFLQEGEKVFIENAQGNTAINNGGANPAFWIVKNVRPSRVEGAGTFDLFNPNTNLPVMGNGTYNTATPGRWTLYPLRPVISNLVGAPNTVNKDLNNDPFIYWRVKGDDRDAGFLGATVDGSGTGTKGSTRIMFLANESKNQVAVNTALSVAKGRYLWTIFGT